MYRLRVRQQYPKVFETPADKDDTSQIVARIFLCHASEDKAQVREVYQRLVAI
jgi:hypothetical protein